jgi:hypothetical protein
MTSDKLSELRRLAEGAQADHATWKDYEKFRDAVAERGVVLELLDEIDRLDRLCSGEFRMLIDACVERDQLAKEVERLKGIAHEFKMLQAGAFAQMLENNRYREALEKIVHNFEATGESSQAVVIAREALKGAP